MIAASEPFLRAALSETPHEYSQDLTFGILFFIVALFAAFRARLYFDPLGAGKVITAFYSFIFLTALFRAIWFLTPSSALEDSYAPKPVVAWITEHWFGTLVSEALLVLGSICLYSIFILVACYWSHMLKKVNVEAIEHHDVIRPKKGPGTLQRFFTIMGGIFLIEIANIALFLSGRTNSQEMILLDSVILSIIAVTTAAYLTLLSTRIRVVLMTIGAINASSTQPQVRRIKWMTYVANTFFVIRVALECTFAVSCLLIMRENQSFSLSISNYYWDTYIAIKHSAEVIVLVLQLMISTAIKTYDNSRSLSATAMLQKKRSRVGAPQTPVTATELTPILQISGGTHATKSSVVYVTNGVV